jgi:hypothetical protein
MENEIDLELQNRLWFYWLGGNHKIGANNWLEITKLERITGKEGDKHD